jgi:hypothetical protein
MDSIELIKKELKSSGSKFFSVEFFKRTTGEKRKYNCCHFGVKKYLKGGAPAYNAGDKNLLIVYVEDTDTKAYRSIPLENVVQATINKKHIIFKKGL